MPARNLDRQLIKATRVLLDATSIALFVPSRPGGSSGSLLVTDGAAPAPPELKDPETAQAMHEAEPAARTATDPGYETLQSRDKDCTLFRLSTNDLLAAVAKESNYDQVERRTGELPIKRDHPPVWVGLRWKESAQADRELWPENTASRVLAALASLVALQMSQMVRFQRDSVTGLPDRVELQARLSQELTVSRGSGRPLSLLLINPDHFSDLTRRAGTDIGLQILREIATRLTDQVRKTDMTARLGRAIFAVVLPGADNTAAAAIARKLHLVLSEASFTDEGHDLTFSLGMATVDPTGKQLLPSDLILRADQALVLARRSGGDCGLEWQAAAENEAFQSYALSTAYTGEAARDARNVVLLSEVVRVVSMFEKADTLAVQFIERLYSSMSPKRVALFDWDDDGVAYVMCGRKRPLTDPADETLFDDEEIRELNSGILAQARLRRRYQKTVIEGTTPNGLAVSANVHAFPLLVGGSCMGCIYFEEPEIGPSLDSVDLQLMRSLGSHLAAALGRARIIETEREQADKEKQRLEGEVEGLRQAISETGLSAKSSEMEEVLMMVHRVAAADVTVLVSGESGVGKGVVCKTIHELSARKQKPFVVVDCASIPPSLIESELFGHEKGAFTGAQRQRSGQLRAAHTGTLFLDEIGELPLEVQSKLLRFVQERTLSPVGSTRSFEVDVRIIAATNRDLMMEVEQGSFREDLYYRLNVVPIRVPPLRQRRDDIADLVEHFLQRYSLLYNRQQKPSVPSQVMAKIIAHDWPGNIRELENRVQQAVVLGGSVLTAADFGLTVEDSSRATGTSVKISLPLDSDSTGRRRGDGGGSTADPLQEREIRTGDDPQSRGSLSDRGESQELLDRLSDTFTQWIRLCRDGELPLLPLGTWSEDELVLQAHKNENGVNQKAADRIGLPATTFKRRHDKAVTRSQTPDLDRPELWGEIRDLLTQIVRAAQELPDRNVMKRVQEILLLRALIGFPGNATAAARLVGVTPVTFKRRASALESPQL